MHNPRVHWSSSVILLGGDAGASSLGRRARAQSFTAPLIVERENNDLDADNDGDGQMDIIQRIFRTSEYTFEIEINAKLYLINCTAA